LSEKEFAERYRRWCKREGYNFSERKAEDIYVSAVGHFCVLPKNESTELLMKQAVAQLNSILIAQAAMAGEMLRLAQMLPEWPVVSAFYGVGGILGPQLMAEIGDVRRFEKKGSLVQFAGLCDEPYQSGKFNATGLPISKKGSPHLRKTLFQVMECILQNKPETDPVFQFLDRKRGEGKHFYNYMTSGSAKFLRIYYARVKQHLATLDEQ
jgi:transposase